MKNKFEIRNPRLTSGQANHETNPNFPNPKSKICNLKSFLHYSKFIILILLFVCLLFAGSCRERVLPPDNGNGVHVPKLKIEAEDIGVTDAFIKLRADSIEHRAWSIELKRDGQTIFTLSSSLGVYPAESGTPSSLLDTLILDEGLLPKRTYKYKAYRLVNNSAIDSSSALLVPTLDTTSHEYFFQIDTLGDGNSSVLYDVALINDTLAFAVGEIYKKDTAGNFEIEPYNLAVWNGKNWTLKRIMVVSQQGEVHSRVLKGVYAFSPTDVWFGDGNAFHWDGRSTFATAYWISGYPGNPTPVLGPNQGVHKFWGTSNSNLFGVGVNGGIAYFNGVSWRRLESGTDVNLTDVWGSPDSSVVWACGYYDDKVGTYLFKYNGIKWELAYDGSQTRFIVRGDSISGAISSVFTLNKRKIFIATNAGIYESISNINGKAKRISFTSSWFPGFPYRLRGNGYNDMFVSGNYYMLAHYNGVTMKHYDNLSGYGKLLSLYQKGTVVFAVGYSMDPIHRKGIVIRGRR